MNNDPKPLTRETSDAIVLGLIECHPDVALETVSLPQVEEWIIARPGLADEPSWPTPI
jgi:Fe-S-cluster formation regulator IscX/YfhJ